MAPLEHELSAPPARAGRLGAVLLGLAALACSGALVALVTSGDAQKPAPTPARPAATPAGRFAPVALNRAEVGRAEATLQSIRTYGGDDAVFAVAASCAAEVERQPAELDYCLAFRRRAAALAASAGHPEAAPDMADALSLARSFTPPGADPVQRLAQVQSLADAMPAFPEPKRARAPVKHPTRVSHHHRRAPAAHRAKCQGRACEAKAKPRHTRARLYPPPWPHRPARHAPTSP